MTQNYADSLAKKIVKQIQSKIAVLEKKKTLPQGFSKEDVNTANQTLDDIKSILTFLDATLAKFDERKKPSLAPIIGSGILFHRNTLKRLSKITITHPNTFELIEMALRLLEELPLDLQDLGEFFNPAAIAVDAKSLGFQLEHIPDQSLDFQEKIAHFRLDQDKAQVFTYRLTHAGEVKTLNAAINYNTQLLPKISFILHSCIETYFKNYQHTPHVQQELHKIQQEPRIKDIQSIWNHQKNWLTTKKTQIPALSFDTTADSIEKLEEDIKTSKALLENYNTHKKELIDRQYAYLTKTMQELAKDPANSENRPWRGKTLPSYSIGLNDDDSVSVIAVIADLNIDSQKIIDLIDTQKNNLERHILFVETQRIPLIQNRQKLHALIDNKTIDLQAKIHQLKQLSKEFSMIIDAKNSLENMPPSDDTEQSINVEFEALDLQGKADQATKETEEQLALSQENCLKEDQDQLELIQKSLAEKQAGLDEITEQIDEVNVQDLEQELSDTKNDLVSLYNDIFRLEKGQKAFLLSVLLPSIHTKITDEKNTIPEKKIISVLRPYTKEGERNFDKFLDLIDLKHESKKWRDFLNTKPQIKENFTKFKTELLTKISEKIESIQSDKNSISEELRIKASFKDKLETLRSIINQLSTNKDSLENKQLILTDTLSRHKNACNKRDLIKKEISRIEYHCDMSDAVLKIGERLLNFKTKINSTNAPSKSDIEQLTSEGDALAQTISDYLNGFDANQDNSYYKARLEQYQKILTDTLGKLPKQQEEPDVIFNNVIADSINKLDAYEQARMSRYRVKDAIFSKDKNERKLFIDKLKQQLNANPIDNKTLRDTLNEGLTRFPGHHLSSILNHIIAEVNKASQDKTIAKIAGDKESLLKPIQDRDEKFAKALLTLYTQIDVMQAYGKQLNTKKKDLFNGKTMCELADALTNQLNYFVKSHQAKTPTADEAQAFVKEFSARLHSQDDRLNQHWSWGKILGNIALALLLIVRLPWTKLTTGRCSFFFEETERHKQVNQLETLAQNTIPLACEPATANHR